MYVIESSEGESPQRVQKEEIDKIRREYMNERTKKEMKKE